MTREEAIKILKEHHDHWMRLYKEGICTKEEGENIIEALEMALKALEQEPCREQDDYENEIEDLHNRLDIAEYDKERLREEVTNLETQIKALEQEPKTGHWIEDTNGTYTDNHDTWECSECGHAQILLEGTPKDNDYNYCPNCGAKLVNDHYKTLGVEPQERSCEG